MKERVIRGNPSHIFRDMGHLGTLSRTGFPIQHLITSSGKAAPRGPDPGIRQRIQIGMIRPIRVDHTKFLQVAIKTHSF
jgi:hypothetical protein